MKALTLTQPWASLVVMGRKRQETRRWTTHYRGPLAIHAAFKFPTEAQWLVKGDAFFRRGLEDMEVGELPLGAILGTVDLVNCFQITDRRQQPLDPERTFGDYRIGRYVWLLEHPRMLLEPIPMRGQLGVWETPADYTACPAFVPA